MNDRRNARALVLGGGMAGLLAARVLAEAYTDVEILDRDDLVASEGSRRGVPQGRHIHALLSRGQQALEELFPGLTGELIAGGAPAGDALDDTRVVLSGHRLRQGPSGLVILNASRPFLEEHVRARVRALPEVTIHQPCDLLGLASTADGSSVTGVRVLRRADGSAAEVIDADLVVDATGRGSRAPQWLEGLGYERPQEERVPIRLAYTTRRFHLDPRALGGDLGALVGPTPDAPRGGAFAALEGDQWIATLFGILGDQPPTDLSGFVDFARSLPAPDIAGALGDAEPLDDAAVYRFPANVWRRYDRLPRVPDGFLPLGDGVCSLNPIYGQGMSVAAVEALTLRRHLRGRLRPRRVLRAMAREIASAWDIAVGGDLSLPGVHGPRTLQRRVTGAYIPRLHAAAAHDARLARAFVRVAGLVDPPGSLLSPRISIPVVRHHLPPGRARLSADAHPAAGASPPGGTSPPSRTATATRQRGSPPDRTEEGGR